MASETLITTVIPTYRRPKLLKRAIRSVLNQTYQNFLVCVFDNASGDETEAVVDEFARHDPRVRYHCNQHNIGLERNFAYGAAQVVTPLFNFLGDDDVLLPQYFETAVAAYEQHPTAKMFVGGVIFAGSDGTIISLPLGGWREGLYEPPDGFSQWMRAAFGWQSAVFTREALEGVGGVDASVGAFLDCDLMLRVASRFPVVFSRTPCAVFFHGGASDKAALLSWNKGELVTKRSIENDRNLDPAVKSRLVIELDRFIARSAFRTGVSHAGRWGRVEDARAAAAILAQSDASAGRVRLVKLFGSDSAAGKVARWTFRAAYRARAHGRRIAAYGAYRRCDLALAAALESATRETGGSNDPMER